SDSGADVTGGPRPQAAPAVPSRPARKGKAKSRVTALGGIVEESGAEESESSYDTAVRAKGPTFARDRSLDAPIDSSVPTRRTMRVTAGNPPAWLETTEIKGLRRASPSPAAGHRTAWSKQVKGGARKGVQIPRAPKAKADWEDERKIARACGQFHPLPLILGESDAAARDAAFALASAADDGQDGKYELYCHVTALLGAQAPIPMKTTVKQLCDMLQDALALIEEARADPLDPPQGRRYPLPPPGTGGHPTIDEMPLSKVTFATLASTDPRMLVRFFTSHGVSSAYLDYSRLPPDVFTSTKPYDDLAWFHTVERAHRFLSKLFKTSGPLSLPQPAALRVILTAYTPSPCGVIGIHSDDAVLFLQGVCPGRVFTSPESAEAFLRGIVHYAHMFNFVCEDFLHRNFPRLLLGVFEYWMEETFAQEVLHDRVANFSHTPAEYDLQVQAVITRARILGKDFMPLSRLLFCPVNEHGLLHLGGHYPRLREMIPRYYEQTRGVKVQMFLYFWYCTHKVHSIEFYTHMTVFGGVAAGAFGSQPIEAPHMLVAPSGNHSWSLLKVQSPIPPRILYSNQTPITSDAAILSEWLEVLAREPLSDNDRIEHFSAFEYRDSLDFPGDGELDYAMAGTVLQTERAEPTVSAHPFTHAIFRIVTAVKKWRRAPLVKACLESPPTSMTANFQDALSLYRIIHRSEPPPADERPYMDSAARFDAEVIHQLQLQGQVPFSLPRSFIDLVTQEDIEIRAAEALSPTPLTHQPTPAQMHTDTSQ
ncbi:hypothetical protein B484DRAFT_471968, partial [Ochromonadaceae sp. CCMP2298]